MSKLVAFIVGAGANVGSAAAALLKEKGYAVAVGSRNPDVEKIKKDGYFPVKVDAIQQDSVKAAYKAVADALGPPNVIIFNPAVHRPTEVAGDPSTLPLSDFNDSIAIGSNVFALAQEAIPGFRSAGHTSNPKAFIVTGNILPAQAPILDWFGLDLQKTISARLVNFFVKAYKAEGFQFSFAFLTSDDGGIPPYSDFLKSGPAHAKAYWELINRKEGPWDYRFTLSGEKLADYTPM
ncbi:hypothetical protein ONZ45_g1205 [Pleurotus djamor]|nr:hypothetical protein ONZ45_g1205 [Pleurotus djamor]